MVVAGSSACVWWRCPLGHDYQKRLVRRAGGARCTYCINKAVWPGFNDAATRFPKLMCDWDVAGNSDFDPSWQLPGNGKHWWRCATGGHIAHETIPNRKRTGGCPRCPAEDRADTDTPAPD